MATERLRIFNYYCHSQHNYYRWGVWSIYYDDNTIKCVQILVEKGDPEYQPNDIKLAQPLNITDYEWQPN